ncbi:MAG: hypothetical protein V1740_06035 [Candidatus Woesearchaeota archaeon]
MIKLISAIIMPESSLSSTILRLKEKNLQSSLNILFKKRQKEIILKILNYKTLTKTEYEYYIRTIKKKLDSIIQLHDLSSITLRKEIKRVKQEK